MQCYLCSPLYLMYFDTNKLQQVRSAGGDPSQSALFVTIKHVKVQDVLASLTRSFVKAAH